MSIYEITYKAKCKHCKYCDSSINPKTKRSQSFCNINKEFTRQNELACEKFEL